MNIFSAFNGIGCGFVALQNCGIKIDKAYSSEIDQRAIKINDKNWPKTIQYGDITKIKAHHFLSKIDLLMGGSPCQDLSIAGKQAGLKGLRSGLFYEFVRLKEELKPTFFFLENVRMRKESQNEITRLLGVEPIPFDSALVCAQTRKRLYWTNIVSVADFVYPEDRGIILNDILEFGESGFVHEFRGETHKYRQIKKVSCIDASYYKGIDNHQARTCVKIGEADDKFDSSARVYSPFGKSPCINTGGGNQEIKVSNIITHSSQPRNGKGKGGKGHLSKQDGKSYCIDTQCSTMVEYADTYRKLTPIEVERCFTLPDNYTKGVSNSARYHGLGNGWDVATIMEFFKHLPK